MGDLVNFFDYTPRYHSKPTAPADIIVLPFVVIERNPKSGFLAAAQQKLARRIADFAGLEPFTGPAP